MLNDVIVVKVEEELFFEDRPTDRAAEVVIAEVLCWCPAKVIVEGIKCVILEILVRRAVESVCPTFADLVV